MNIIKNIKTNAFMNILKFGKWLSEKTASGKDKGIQTEDIVKKTQMILIFIRNDTNA